MAYCRFSSDNFRSDVYVYEGIGGGFVMHLAGNRYVGDIPEVPAIGTVSMEKFLAAHKKQMDYLKNAKTERIELPHAGESFVCSTAKECAEFLEKFKALGYRVPEGVIPALLEE